MNKTSPSTSDAGVIGVKKSGIKRRVTFLETSSNNSSSSDESTNKCKIARGVSEVNWSPVLASNSYTPWHPSIPSSSLPQFLTVT